MPICTRCKIERDDDQFLSIRGKVVKMCQMCRNYRVKLRQCPCGKRKDRCALHGGSALCPCGKEKTRCKIHGGSAYCHCGKRKEYCQTHGGSSLCLCGKRKEYCQTHGGSSLCPCGKNKSKCSLHGGASLCQCGKEKNSCKKCSDPIRITISSMINHSKQKDIQKNRYDANNFIDRPFLKQLIDKSTLCFYCNIQMQFIDNNDTLCTIERLNNSIGHTKANCVLACRKCNYSKVGQKS